MRVERAFTAKAGERRSQNPHPSTPRVRHPATRLGSFACLSEAIGTIAKEFEESEIAEDLELLADFVADVGVVGMKFGQRVGVSIDIGEIEFEFAQGLHYLKHVESPASFFYL